MVSTRTPQIGVNVDDLRLDLRRGLRQAATLDVQAVELGAVSGEATPDQLGASGRRELKRFAENLGLSIVSLSADMPRLRFTDPNAVEQRIDRTQRIIDLARDLAAPVVTTGVGTVTDPDTGKPYDLLVESLGRLGEYADARGVRLALRPSNETGLRWAALLKSIHCPAVGVCLDPAAAVMAGANPLAAIDQFVEQVVIFYARDATAGYADPHGGEPRFGHETPLGEGDVDLIGVLDILREADYRGPYILRRTDARDPQSELIAARKTLLRML